MDDRKLPISQRTPCGLSDADAAADSVVDDSSVVYFGSSQRINKGFAIALRAMGVEAGILPADPGPTKPAPNQEDT
ncbi:hypothetical protein FXB40_46590 [Bradyrhizobium rifense]|uniref:Uncharacterized protein n=1 Tax=Bradyrhizobium rifense TaxID=515499 RepID=A0A5D3JYD6_9BRAD|nr:hypothetical protein [Bradyrhizobium rifense]TYL83183.1 hypothetical protein FXB40_46590 [Bradyrhizobium rifense]